MFGAPTYMWSIIARGTWCLEHLHADMWCIIAGGSKCSEHLQICSVRIIVGETECSDRCEEYYSRSEHIRIYWDVDFSTIKWTAQGKFRSITTDPNPVQKLKLIERFGDSNWVNSSNFIASQIFWEIRPSFFSCFFLFSNMFPESDGFVAMSVTSSIKDTCSNLSLSDWWMETKLFKLVTSTPTKPWLSGNLLANIETCGNLWSNFPENPRVVAIKLLELTQIASPNI